MSNTTQNTPELLPCPFCGGEAKLTNPNNTPRVVCRSYKTECAGQIRYFNSEDAAIQAWNARATTPTPSPKTMRSAEIDKLIAHLRSKPQNHSENISGWNREFKSDECLAADALQAQAALLDEMAEALTDMIAVSESHKNFGEFYLSARSTLAKYKQLRGE